MRILLDTHSMLWFALGDERLSDVAKDLIENDENEVCISAASYWEIAIKVSIGKYILHRPVAEFYEDVIESNRFEVIPVDLSHIAIVSTMEFPFNDQDRKKHKDPFDRLIIAQAMCEDIPLVTRDSKFDLYQVQVLW